VRQFVHGLSLPFHLARALRSDARAWRRYLWVGIVQSLVILALALTCSGSADEAVDRAQERAERAQEAARAEAADTTAAGEPQHFKREVSRKSPRLETNLVIEELEFWAALFAALQIAQWVVIALSRDYHDAISRDASLLTALEPEDEPLTPRLRVDLKWMGKKFSRRMRAFLIIMAGMPAFFLLSAPFYFARDELLTVLVSLWSAYWVVVFTTSKTARAWDDTSGRQPWFLRTWNWLTTRVPGLRWGFLQAYGRFWAKRSSALFSPALELEKQPWAFAGLAVIRTLTMLPLVKCFLRPLIPVAAAHLILAQRSVAPAEPVEPSAPPVQPAAPSSANAA
jgi:hypothetical protein